MKPWLVDVPVRVNIWIRPACQKAQFEVLRQARPSTMFLISDGGRNEAEWEAIRENRALFDNEIDWECTVYKVYEEKNNGLYAMVDKGRELIWSKVDRCIFLEDDHVPSVSYFAFCAELLEKYKNDERIQAVCAMNHCGVWEPASADYFFTRGGAIWGLATWKRCDAYRDPDHSYSKDPYTMHLLKQSAAKFPHLQRRYEGYAKNKLYQNHPAGSEFYHGFAIYGQHRLYIVPKYNMISNIGCTTDAAHASEYLLLPRGVRQVFNMKTYEYTLPLKHPKYVISDEDYVDRQARIMGINHPWVQRYRRMEGLFLALRYKGLSGLREKFKNGKKRRKTIEK